MFAYSLHAVLCWIHLHAGSLEVYPVLKEGSSYLTFEPGCTKEAEVSLVIILSLNKQRLIPISLLFVQ